MKRRTKVVALATSLLVGVSMMGVGFATWVISHESQGEAEGNIKAEAVDKSALFDFTVEGESQTIVFGTPDAGNSSTGTDWLTYTDGTKAVLSATYTLKFVGNIDDITVTLDVDNTFWEAVAANYITGPTLSLSSNTYYSVTDGTFTSSNASTGITLTAQSKDSEVATEQSVTVTISFNWGSAFGNKNPYEYYNGLSYSYDNAKAAQTALDTLYTKLGSASGISYKFTFKNAQ